MGNRSRCPAGWKAKRCRARRPGRRRPDTSVSVSVMGMLLPDRFSRADHSEKRAHASRTGNLRTRFPVAAKIALHKAGATGGTPGSPMPPIASLLGTMCTST